MSRNRIFSTSEKKVIGALYRLDRWATANEIADWAEISWNTAKAVLRTLNLKEIVKAKTVKGTKYWRIREEYTEEY
jgi:hypothetical protein